MGLLKDAGFLLTLREELAAEEQRLAKRRMALARQHLSPSDDASVEEWADVD